MNLIQTIFGQTNISNQGFPVNKNTIHKFQKYWNIEEEFENIKKEIRKEVMKALIKKLKQHYDVIYAEEFLSGEKLQPLFISYDKYLENLNVDYAIESDKPNFLKLRLGIRADFCDEKKPMDKIIQITKNKEYQKQVIHKFYPNFESAEDLINKIKREAKIYFGENIDEKPCWLVTGHFKSYYGDNSQKEFYLEILEKGFEEVANVYLEEIKDFIMKTVNPFSVLNEIED
ncbi:hypothetical protein [Nitratiruptor tergarcus]|uniref:Uncharacterized protein n=1 Tax=Nitratiruptor tergarcus DSM 16512 TaxID=1069081 RepID=A0A1W1WWF4_9BACT|nr:hypothetical protein [Nitratiruptor tergarcus]SMC10073.1 hypothetical protein SAMN05660197_1908 [Nitratiruptor tergarcus DSM 16512]